MKVLVPPLKGVFVQAHEAAALSLAALPKAVGCSVSASFPLLSRHRKSGGVPVRVVLESGDVGRLRELYGLSPRQEFTHGIVGGVVFTKPKVGGDAFVPRTVSLFLFNPGSEEVFLGPGPAVERGFPTFVDFSGGELVILRKHHGDHNIRGKDLSGGR